MVTIKTMYLWSKRYRHWEASEYSFSFADNDSRYWLSLGMVQCWEKDQWWKAK